MLFLPTPGLEELFQGGSGKAEGERSETRLDRLRAELQRCAALPPCGLGCRPRAPDPRHLTSQNNLQRFPRRPAARLLGAPTGS